jgi:hypothetical protein
MILIGRVVVGYGSGEENDWLSCEREREREGGGWLSFEVR